MSILQTQKHVAHRCNRHFFMQIIQYRYRARDLVAQNKIHYHSLLPIHDYKLLALIKNTPFEME